MPVPLRYNLRSLFYRKTATFLTMLAVALTVAVLIILLATARGFTSLMKDSGRTDNIIVLRSGATSEGESTLTRSEVNTISGFSGIATESDGKSLFAFELFAGINLPRQDGETTNISLRGSSEAGLRVRNGLRVSSGRMFKSGSREVLVGRNLVGKVRGCAVGGVVKITKDEWEVVGVLDGNGSAFDSEIWGDAELLAQAFDRPFFNSVIFRSNGKREAEVLAKEMGNVKVQDERAYFISQSGFLGGFLQSATMFLTVLMSFGALAGCINTLMAAVAGRTREIGGLLAVGYRPMHIFVGFLIEALALCAIGGVIGILATLWVNGKSFTTTNWQTFTEIAFTLRIDGSVITTAFVLAVLIGVIGGSIPAWRAARLKPVDALRNG